MYKINTTLTRTTGACNPFFNFTLHKIMYANLIYQQMRNAFCWYLHSALLKHTLQDDKWTVDVTMLMRRVLQMTSYPAKEMDEEFEHSFFNQFEHPCRDLRFQGEVKVIS